VNFQLYKGDNGYSTVKSQEIDFVDAKAGHLFISDGNYLLNFGPSSVFYWVCDTIG
jgi:hypothetical protein